MVMAQSRRVLLPRADGPETRLTEAMRYAVLGGGKRVRAALVYAAGQACTANGNLVAIDTSLDRAAAAVELIHAYSLAHDDLPCMDDDSLRRGRPATHVQFDEATAMLAGDALQPLAFELLADMPIAPALVVQAVQSLARAQSTMLSPMRTSATVHWLLSCWRARCWRSPSSAKNLIAG